MNDKELEEISNEDLENEILYDILNEDLKIDNEMHKVNKKKQKHHKREEKRKQREARIVKLKSILSIKTVLLLILTLLANTYAWFIYVNQVSTSLDMHVRGWDFTIVDDEQDEKFEFVIDKVNPGMPEAIRNINASNNGEMKANVKCEINQIRIFNDTYKLGDNNPKTNKPYTSKDLFTMLLNDYPFKVEAFINDQPYDGSEFALTTGEKIKITFKVNWPYETSNPEIGDVEDTKWGNKSYEFMQNNPDLSSIEILFEVIATQGEV